jgi:hypothetical protein
LNLLGQEYPRFSDAEHARRHRALGQVMRKHDLDHLLVITDHRAGNAPQWVSGWPGTVEAYVIFKPGEQMTMHVEWFNHFPLAKRLAVGVDVRWGEHRGIQKTAEEPARRGATRVGLIGPLVAPKVKYLEERFCLVPMDSEYVHLRLVKSEEEIEWLRIGAALSDAPRICVPPQFASSRKVMAGDIVFCELSASFWRRGVSSVPVDMRRRRS